MIQHFHNEMQSFRFNKTGELYPARRVTQQRRDPGYYRNL